jgi:hypothetical protein
MANQINADSGIRRRSQTFRDLALSLLPRNPHPRSGAILVLSLSKDGPGLIDEDEPLRIDLPLIGFPARPLAGDVRPVLLTWQNGFF